jgi:hypothetical protein
MRQIGLATIATIFIGVLVPAGARGEAPIAPNNACRTNIAARPIEPQQPITLKGRVVGLEYGKQQRIAATNMVMWLRLKTDSGEIRPVYLGSSWYLDRRHLQVRVGDTLEIRGVKVPGSSSQSAMTIANTIKKGDRVWKASIPNKPNVAKSCQPI